MEKDRQTNPLTPVLCALCLAYGPGIMTVGKCEECDGPTGSGAYRYCAECATKHGICCQCGEPLDKKGD